MSIYRLNFTDTRLLSFLAVLPFLVAFYLFARRRRFRLVARFCRPEMAGGVVLTSGGRVFFLRILMVLVAVGLMVVSAAGPRWGFHFEEVAGRSANIVIALDLSKSMLAEDIKPSRLVRAKREIFDMLEMFSGERVGLVGFAGAAYVQSPLTVDYSVLKSFVEEMTPDGSISSGGSDIGLAVNTARRLFKEGEGGAVILITDGEDFEGRLLKEAKDANKEGIVLYTIGVGKSEGSPIPESGGFKKDSAGNLVITRLDSRLLEKTASITGGTFVRSVAGDDDIRAVYVQGISKQIGEVEYSATRKKVWEERFQWFLLPAAILLFAEQVLSGISKKGNGYSFNYTKKIKA